MELSFKGKTVIVTGGAGGFGRATAERFSESGATVVVADIDFARAEEVASSLPAAVAVRADVLEEGSVRDLILNTVADHGGLDVMVNNAGLPHRSKPFEEMTSDEVDFQLSMNIRSVIYGCKYAIPALRQSNDGVLINVASIAGRRPRPGMAVYNATKGAVITLTRSLAGELAPEVRVNAVNPVVSETGFIRNALGTDVLDAQEKVKLVSGIPMGRTAEPADIANAILYLASGASSFLTGVCLDVDGGRSIQ